MFEGGFYSRILPIGSGGGGGGVSVVDYTFDQDMTALFTTTTHDPLPANIHSRGLIFGDQETDNAYSAGTDPLTGSGLFGSFDLQGKKAFQINGISDADTGLNSINVIGTITSTFLCNDQDNNNQTVIKIDFRLSGTGDLDFLYNIQNVTGGVVDFSDQVVETLPFQECKTAIYIDTNTQKIGYTVNGADRGFFNDGTNDYIFSSLQSKCGFALNFSYNFETGTDRTGLLLNAGLLLQNTFITEPLPGSGWTDFGDNAI